MDFKMMSEKTTDGEKIWDCKVTGGNVPIISGTEEDQQTATLAGFLIRGTIPQLPEAGVPWIEFLGKSLTFGELDYYIRESIRMSGKTNYFPQYDIDEDQLVMSVGKMEDNINELYL